MMVTQSHTKHTSTMSKIAENNRLFYEPKCCAVLCLCGCETIFVQVHMNLCILLSWKHETLTVLRMGKIDKRDNDSL